MRTIAGLFDSLEQARRAVIDLESNGIRRANISLVASAEPAGSAGEAGTAIGAGLGLLAGLAIVAVPGIGALAALGPILAGGAVGAVAGGLAGRLVDAGIPEHEAHHYVEGVRQGATLLMVAASDDDAPRAVEILGRHHPADLEQRALLWRKRGWTPGAAARSTISAPDVASNQPDPTGTTTMGDAASEMPLPDAQPPG
jgi:hypothetical protein